jgi:hypothetical protein
VEAAGLVSQDQAAFAAEQAVLGAMLQDPAITEQVLAILRDETDFALPPHRTVYRTVVRMHAAGVPCDAVTILGALSDAGELDKIGGGAFLHTLIASVPVVEMGPFYARRVVDQADQRQLQQHALRLDQAARTADPDQRAALVAEVTRRLAEVQRPAGGFERARPLDWATFLTREQGPVDFLAGRLMTRGQQVAIVGHGKAGKSLLCEEWCWRISAGLPFLGDGPRPPLRVMYVDMENPDDEIQERLLALGATAETLQNLVYLSFPAWRPLNSEAGAADFLAAVDEYRPAVVFLDTISRMVKGEENAADTWLALYRLALMPLKARGISSIRLDHFGKDATRGSRGNSAKNQDVDAVWELTPVEGDTTLLQLTRTHTRSGKGPDELLVRRHGELVGDRWKASGTWHGVADESERPSSTPDPDRQYRPAARRVLGVLGSATGPLTVRQIGDELAAQTGGPLKPRTIQDALRTLAEAGEADECEVAAGKPALWVHAGQPHTAELGS